MTTRLLAVALLWLMAAGCAHFSQSASDDSPYLQTHVVRISEEYANINTDLSGKTLAKRGIVLQQSFQVRYKDREFSALLGADYSDVEHGDWVALIEEDGNLQLAISFGNAATELGCVVGDTLYITPLDP